MLVEIFKFQKLTNTKPETVGHKPSIIFKTMIQRLIFGLTILLAISCSEKSKKDSFNNLEQQKEMTPFESVYDTLDFLTVPITLTPEKWSEWYRNYLTKYGPKPDWDLLKHPYAKLTENSNYKGIIFISTDETGSPTLVTIDKEGQPIDTLFLLGDWGGNDPSIGTTEIVTINSDYTIHLIDSTSTFDVGPNGDRIEGTGKLTVTNERYQILENGKIEKIR